MGVGDLDLARNSLEEIELEVLRECCFSLEHWLPCDEVVVAEVCERDLLEWYPLWY